jgi:hypothetical protein
MVGARASVLTFRFLGCLRRSRPLALCLIFILLFTGLPPMPVSADTVPFAITANDLNGAVWEANASYLMAQSGSYEDVVLAHFIADRFTQDPNVDPNEVIREVQVFQTAFSQMITHAQPSFYHDNHAAYDTMQAAADILEQLDPALTKSTVQWVRQSSGGNWADPQNRVSTVTGITLGLPPRPRWRARRFITCTS